MYAEKTGVGSVLSPREMMMPRGSDELVSLRSFFITLSLCDGHTVARLQVKALDMPRRTSAVNTFADNNL